MIRLSSFDALAALFPLQSQGSLLIEHDATWLNYAPSGCIPDPLNPTAGFLLYVSKFSHYDANTDIDAKISVYSGSIYNPGVVTYLQDAILKGAPGQWDSNGIYASGCQVISDGGTVYALYGARASVDGYYRIGLASSVDGRNFTKHSNNPVLTPPPTYRDPRGGYQSGMFRKANGLFYFYPTLVRSIPLVITDGQGECHSADCINWTDDQIVVLPKGATYDSVIIEAGDSLRIGSDYPLLYSATNGSSWKILLANQVDPTSVATKWGGNPAFAIQGTNVACPILREMGRGQIVLFYQRCLDPGVGSTWDVWMTTLLPPLGGSVLGGASLFGAVIR